MGRFTRLRVLIHQGLEAMPFVACSANQCQGKRSETVPAHREQSQAANVGVPETVLAAAHFEHEIVPRALYAADRRELMLRPSRNGPATISAE
jgi:hypothetical protein